MSASFARRLIDQAIYASLKMIGIAAWRLLDPGGGGGVGGGEIIFFTVFTKNGT